MTPEQYITKSLLLPDLKLERIKKISSTQFHCHVHKTSPFEVCPHCAVKASKVHDHRTVYTRHTRLKGNNIWLVIRKRRFRCPQCKKVFTEPVGGIRKGFRTSAKYRREILFDCERFMNLKEVGVTNKCSQGLVSKVFYEGLGLKLREFQKNPWPQSLGIDEHSLKRKGKSRKCFVTSFVDLKNKKMRELVLGKKEADLTQALSLLSGREKVKHVVIDLTDGYKNFSQNHFLNAKIVADKFHVLRLIDPTLDRYRKEATDNNRKNPIRYLLRKRRDKLTKEEKRAIYLFLEQASHVKEVYFFKQRLMGFYRIKGYKQARRVFAKLTKDMALSQLAEIQTLRQTLLKWKEEILEYFKTGLTNARTEGFNRKAKLIQRSAYGYSSFKNYRLRLLYACR